MVVSETYGAPDVCGSNAGPCPARHTSTTWSWSAATPHRLVITNPRPVKTVALVRSVPSGIGGERLTGRSVQVPLQPGQRVLVVCAVTQLSGLQTKSTGLITDTGTWLPSVDLKPVDVPDCDAASAESATTANNSWQQRSNRIVKPKRGPLHTHCAHQRGASSRGRGQY